MYELSELGAWSENGHGQGWEEELTVDEDHIVHASRVAIKEKRRMERECRRQAQDTMRAQKKTALSHPTLGTKTNA